MSVIDDEDFFPQIDPTADFQQVPLQTSGIYNFVADQNGRLHFNSGTTFPFGISVDQAASFRGPVTINALGGVIQIGATHGYSGAPNSEETQEDQGGDNFDANGDVITVYGDVWTLPEYINNLGSDSRAKKNIIPISNALSKVNRLSGNTFEWTKRIKPAQTKGPGDKDYGLIAQEVKEVLPEAVSEINGWLTVDYVKIIPLLVESIKDLTNEVKYLKEKLNG